MTIDTVLTKDSIRKRLLKFSVIPDDKTQCWGWTGKSLDLHGSPMLGVKRPDGTWGTEMAGRLMYWVTFGNYDPDLIVIRDTCNNPLCVNPDHMKLVNKEDHMVILGHQFQLAHGEAHHFAVLNDDLVRKLRSGKLSMKTVMAMTGISYTVVRKAKLGITWKHVT